MESIIKHYTDGIEKIDAEIEKSRRNIRLTSLVRICVFLLFAFSIYMLWPLEILGGVVLVCLAIVFLVLAKWHNGMFLLKENQEQQLRVYKEELAALDGNTSSFATGQKYEKASHPYAVDLDVFGKGSLYQMLCRATTIVGQDKLAESLLNYSTDASIVVERQKAIAELAAKPEFRESFRAEGLCNDEGNDDYARILTWKSLPNYFLGNRFWIVISWAVPSINVFLFVMWACGLVPASIATSPFFLFVIFSLFSTKKISLIQDNYGRKLQSMLIYTKLISKIEALETESSQIKSIKLELTNGEQSASTCIRQMAKALQTLDQRNNILVSVVLDGLFFWQVRSVIKIEQLKELYAPLLEKWLDALGRFESLCSLANYAYNHPENTYPQIDDSDFCFVASELAHPLMNPKVCVRNNLNMPTRPFFLVITGANMAGKSTWLRTVGTNYLLACLGTTVSGKDVKICPTQLHTSLRTTDSLADGESYFFAELKRMKQILTRLENGERMFILLDEILRGTNSKDKQKGSLAFVRQLMLLKANGIIATHDIMVGNLIESFPESIRNYCFEAEIENDKLSFSYKMRQGVASNMNACFLMRKMGIEVD